jgi:hypothetical protein
MIDNNQKFQSSFIEINEHNELVINNKKKQIYKTNEMKQRINDSLKNKNVIEHFFLSNKIDGSTINILIG